MEKSLSGQVPDEAGTVDRVAGLLSRYPNLTPLEVREIIHFLRRGPHLDIGLLSGRDEVKPALAAFREDHARALGLDRRDYMIAFLIVLAILLVCWMIMDVGM